MKRKSIFLCFIFIICFACTNEKENAIPTANIGEQVFSPKEMPLSEIVESIEVVPLETSEEILLSTVFVEMTDKGFLVQSRNLSLFDHEGNWVRDITQKGPGPREVPFISHYFVKNDLIYVTSGHICKVFDYEGNVHETFQLPVYPSGFGVLSDTKYIAGLAGMGGDPSGRLAFFSKEELLEKYDRPFSTEGRQSSAFSLGAEGTYKAYNGTVYMKELLNDTIYRVDVENDTIQPILAFNFGKYASDPTYRYNDISAIEELYMYMPMTYFIGNNERLTVLFTMMPDMARQVAVEATCWYNHKTKEGHAAALYYTDEQVQILQKALGNGYNPSAMKHFIPMTMSLDGQYLIAYIYPENEDNPALVLAKLK